MLTIVCLDENVETFSFILLFIDNADLRKGGWFNNFENTATTREYALPNCPN